MTDDLDRVLEGLGRAEIPLGLEERVLSAIEAREPRRGFVWAWVAVAALLLVVGLVGSLGRGKGSKAAGLNVAMQPHSVGQTAIALDGVVVPEARKRVEPRPPTITASLRVAVIMGHPASEVAVEAGFPAAEEPLSEQEKLLLKLARRPTPTTMALFNLKLREQHAAMAKAEFDEFFKPVVVATTEPDPDLRVANPAGKEEKKDEALAEKK